MSELSPRARELMRRAAPGGGPTEGQRRALKRSVLAVLVPAVAGAAVTKLVLVGLLVAAVSAGVTVSTVTALRGTPSPSPSPRVAAAPASVQERPQPTVVAAAPVAVVAPPRAPAVEPPPLPAAAPAPALAPVPRAAPPRPVPATPEDTPPLPPPPVWAPSLRTNGPTGLAREMQTLDRALRAVDEQRFEDGLLEARRFLTAFPESEFGIEARVVEVLALCGLSRVEEAKSAAASLPTSAAGNPAVRRLESSCVRSSTR